VDKNRIEQVFINISMNAAQAMPNGGTLIFRTYTKILSQSDKGVGRRKEDIYKVGETVVLAEVGDTGPGIPEDYLDKIFDPFFTTKRGKGGTGLGLSSVKNIMELHKGQIEIRNNESGGTKVTLVFKIDK
jgi:signal transduction histidine kinase